MAQGVVTMESTQELAHFVGNHLQRSAQTQRQSSGVIRRWWSATYILDTRPKS